MRGGEREREKWESVAERAQGKVRDVYGGICRIFKHICWMCGGIAGDTKWAVEEYLMRI